MILQIILNFIWTVEWLSDICFLGPSKAFNGHFRVWPETICQILNLIAVIDYLPNMTAYGNYNQYIKQFEVIIFIRMLKLLTLLYEIRAMRIIIETVTNMLTPLTQMFCVLMVVFYLYAVLGMLLFGGQIKRSDHVFQVDNSIPDTYHLCNFNCLFSSMVTLFTLMVVNNWMIQVDMYV